MAGVPLVAARPYEPFWYADILSSSMDQHGVARSARPVGHQSDGTKECDLSMAPDQRLDRSLRPSSTFGPREPLHCLTEGR